jgi:hypothetical protein
VLKKGKRDILGEFHMATKREQDQTAVEAQYGHLERMARITAKQSRREAKHSQRMAEIELQKLQLQLQAANSLQSGPSNSFAAVPLSDQLHPGNGLQLDFGDILPSQAPYSNLP